MAIKFKRSLIISGMAIAAMAAFIMVAFFGNVCKETALKSVDRDKYGMPAASKEESFKGVLPEFGEKPLNFLFFGDMMLDRHVGEKISQHGPDWLFEKLASSTKGDFFADYDIISVNLEGAVTNFGAHYAPQMSYDFAFHPDLIRGVMDYGFNFFSLANNHFSDQGERGMIETRENLEKLNVDYAGCQDGEIGDCSIKIIEKNNKKIGQAAFSMVYSLFDRNKASEIISALASSSDLVIVNIHWGREYEHAFDPVQAETARLIIDAGADIIIGHHPHVVQGIEIYKNKPIFYSLGNFVFDQYFSVDTQEGLAVGILLAEDSVTCELFPFKSRLSQAELMDEEEREEMFNKILFWSDVNPEFSGQIKAGKLEIRN